MTLKKSIWVYKPHPIEIIVTKKNMKRMILKFKDGTFQLSQPSHVSDEKMMEWLNSLSNEQFAYLQSHYRLKQGDDFIYLFGRRYQLEIKDMNLKKVVIKERKIIVYHKNYLDIYLKELLQAYIEKRIKELALVNFKVEVQIQAFRSKYGCCYYEKQLVKFASKLVHEPQVVIDSIIIHELAHFYHHNHGSQFYQFVRSHDPYYDRSQAFLKNGGVGDDPIDK